MAEELQPTIEPTELIAETEVKVDPIYRYKDGRIITKKQLIEKENLAPEKIDDWVSKNVLTQIGDTEDATQEYSHKNGKTYTGQQLFERGITIDRIANGIKEGKITPIEKKKSEPLL